MANALMNIYGGAPKKFKYSCTSAEIPYRFFPSPRESHDISFHRRGNPATLASIPAEFPRIPRDSRDPYPRAGLSTTHARYVMSAVCCLTPWPRHWPAASCHPGLTTATSCCTVRPPPPLIRRSATGSEQLSNYVAT